MKGKRYINFAALGSSLIFLFNPNINVIDFLPDFIGYILLCVALTNLSDINETISEAQAGFKKLIFIDVSKIIALMWIFGISVTSEKNSSLMLWSFVFGVLEMLFAIPAFNKLFKGINELGFFYNNTTVNSVTGNKKRSRTDSLSAFTTFFVALKAIMAFLPELADLTSTEYYENQGLMNIYRYIGIMRFLAFVPVFIVGIIWIFKCVLYFRKLNSDVDFCGALQNEYCQKILPKKSVFVKRNVKLSFLLLLLAIAFSFDIRFEYVNVLPDFISGALFLAFFLVIAKKIDINKKLSLISAGAYVLTGMLSSTVEFLFLTKYNYSSIYRDEQAYSFFTVLVICACANVLAFAFVTGYALKACNQVIKDHTGVITVTGNTTRITDQIQSDLRRNLIYCAVATILYIASDILYIFLSKDYGFMLMINVIEAIIFVASYCKAYYNIIEAVESKYILE